VIVFVNSMNRLVLVSRLNAVPVRYELNFYVLFEPDMVFKGLEMVLNPYCHMFELWRNFA
jgi:hypothetical protein